MNNWLAGECLSHGKGRGPRGSKLHHTTASTLSAHDICKPYWRKSHIWALAEWGNCRPWRERKNCNSGSIITEGEMERGVRVRETRKQILSFRSSLTHSQAKWGNNRYSIHICWMRLIDCYGTVLLVEKLQGSCYTSWGAHMFRTWTTWDIRVEHSTMMEWF